MQSAGEKYAEKFQVLLEHYPNPETGKPWRTVEFERATNGFLSRSYIASLSHGRINNPGMDKLQKISELMGFPFDYWLTELGKWSLNREQAQPRQSPEPRSTKTIAFLLNHLIEIVPNESKGRPHTNRELSLLTTGRLSEKEISDLRNGHEDNPTFSTLLILSEAFDVDPAYWFVNTTAVSRLESGILEALKDEQNYEIIRKSKDLPNKEKDVLLSMVDQLKGLAESRQATELSS